jgi:acetylornithine/N-succinyldiaminopimelate aminotransferase
MFGFEHYGIQPDIIAIAKAMGGGFPIGGMLCKKKVAENIEYGDHGTTYGGNPLACAASLAAIQTVLDEDLISQAAKKGELLKDELKKHAADLTQIRDIRGRGLMIGVELSFEGRPVVEELMKRGILSNCTQGSVIRFVPPLTISEENLISLAKTFVESIEKISHDV